MRTAYLCDFDGTISPTDIGAALIGRFGTGDDRPARELLARWTRGEVGHRELTIAETARMRVHEAEARAFALGFDLDPGFAGFVAEARSRGDAVMVVSEGFDFYVVDQLARAGLADLPFAANRARFASGGLVPEFPWTAEGCGRCGNCKAQHARRWRAQGYRVVTIGDGLSDRCGAEASDAVIAKDGLLEWCRASGIAATLFHDFTALAGELRSARRSA
jgi:2-hydroxy-3-keto-5-methylthiopentenyl-1-phosphate phosphatase